ncbi:MAG TPA: protein kinase [Pyrinomonadaceae bacterium]|nr:protein kinase [Pyrinomonadaceae bacterium]
MMLTPDTVLQGRYRIVRQLGQGGMGAVYEAIDQRLDTTVALKETLFTEERLRKQFEREARLLARLHHPALPRVSDHFSEGDGQFLVMQFIPGDDLSEMMTRKHGPFPVDQVLTWADQLLDALDYLHTQDPQIIHRDIKPQNLKLTSRGQIILLDFGLAKGQAGEISRVTTSASIFGYTPNYAPLEQIQGLGTDSRSDLYSLGATLYHLMTGVKPPDALTRAAALVNGLPDPLARASEANSAVASELDHVLSKSMAQNRDQRYPTASEMRKAFHSSSQAETIVNRGEAKTMLFPPPPSTVAVPTQTVAASPKTVPTGETTVVRRGPARRILPIALSAAVVLLVACGVFGFYLLQNRNEQSDESAVENPQAVASPAVASPTPDTSAALSPDENEDKDDEPAPAPTRQERASRNEERKAPTPRTEEKRAETDAEVHSDPKVEVEVDAPTPPGVPGSTRVQTKRLPSGVVIRTFPDGTQIITTKDGMRVLVTKDGEKKILNPPRPNRRRQLPPPAPVPSP